MNSAHSNERNLAHCAATAMSHTQQSYPQQTATNELIKLKEGHERQIQTLKLEHKIELLEMNNKMSKEENDNKTKILELQKEVQSLKHENELMKLKSVHELQSNKMVVDSNSEKQMAAKEIEFKDRLNEKDKEIALKDNEMTLKIAEKDKEMALKIAEKANEMTLKIAEKDNEMALKIAEKDNEMALKMSEKDKESALKMAEKDGTLLKKENEHKIETVKMKNEMEKTIESLRNEVQMLKTNDQSAGIDNDVVAKKEEIADPLKLPLIERLEMGVNHYIYRTKLHGTPLLKASYQEWYENLANAMENIKLYNNERFLFMRKAFGTCQRKVHFVNYDIDKKCQSFGTAFEVKGLDTQLLEKGEFILLHPKNSLKFSRTKQMMGTYCNGTYHFWEFNNVPQEFFFGPNKIAIVCWVLKDN